MDRRKVLERAGVLGGAALIAMAPATAALADEAESEHTLEGAWIGPTNAGPAFPPFTAAYTFARGGGMVTSSSIDLSPRSLSTPGYGAWKRTGERDFLFTFKAFVFDPQGNPAGVVTARATATLDVAGNAWSGTFKFDVVAPNGVTVFSGGGTHSAVRIQVEPL
jgi:hypothetical protein